MIETISLFVSCLLQSHELHSDDELRDCDSDEGDHMTRVRSRLNASMTSNGGADISGHEHTGDMQMRFVFFKRALLLIFVTVENFLFTSTASTTIISFQQIIL